MIFIRAQNDIVIMRKISENMKYNWHFFVFFQKSALLSVGNCYIIKVEHRNRLQ